MATAKAIALLWSTTAFRRVFALRQTTNTMDNATVFFDNILQYASDEYTPTFEDYLLIRDRSTS